MRTVKILLMFLALTMSGGPAHAVAQWARQYGMPCEGCHTTYPRLNMNGLRFRRNGYRFDLGKMAVITERKISDYIAPTWTPSWTQTGEKTAINLNGIKIHIGGAVGRSAGFLIQPTPGGAADFNLIQGMLVSGTQNQSYRLVGGRIQAWLNGGSVGAGDRAIGATIPQMFSELHGISPGGIGDGARFEVNWKSGATFALFTSDMEATKYRVQTSGISMLFPLDTRTVSALELFASYGSVPVAGSADAQAYRFGLVANRWLGGAEMRAHFNIQTGFLYGTENRAVKAGLPTNLASAFLELDWQPKRGTSLFARYDWGNNVLSARSVNTFTIGAAVPITRNIRWDTDIVTTRPNANTLQAITRVRLVY